MHVTEIFVVKLPYFFHSLYIRIIRSIPLFFLKYHNNLLQNGVHTGVNDMLPFHHGAFPHREQWLKNLQKPDAG
jgi:hypothetical protein